MGNSCLPITAVVTSADRDHNGCIDLEEAVQLRAPNLLGWLTDVDPVEAKRFVQQLQVSSLPTFYRLYAYAHRYGFSNFLFPPDMPSLSWDPLASDEDHSCPVHLTAPMREPVERLTMGAATLYGDVVRETESDATTQVASEYSSFNPTSDRLIILYGENHGYPAVIHDVVSALAKLIRRYGIGFIASEVMSTLPHSCLPQILESELGDGHPVRPAGSYDLMQLMFPDLDFFGAESERVMDEHVARVVAKQQPSVDAVRRSHLNGEIDEATKDRELHRLLSEAFQQVAFGGIDDRNRASAGLLLAALQDRGAHVIVYTTGALHVPVLAQELRKSGKTSVLTLVPRGMTIHPDRVDYKH